MNVHPDEGSCDDTGDCVRAEHDAEIFLGDILLFGFEGEEGHGKVVAYEGHALFGKDEDNE